MASREKQLSELTQTSDSPRGPLAQVADRLIYPFLHGEPPKPQTPTGFYTDTTVCIGCKACEVACKQWNQLPSDGFEWSGNSYDNTAELSASTWRHVKFIEQFSGAPSGNGISNLTIWETRLSKPKPESPSISPSPRTELPALRRILALQAE